MSSTSTLRSCLSQPQRQNLDFLCADTEGTGWQKVASPASSPQALSTEAKAPVRALARIYQGWGMKAGDRTRIHVMDFWWGGVGRC